MHSSPLINRRAFGVLDTALSRSVAEKVTEYLASNGIPMFSGALPTTLDAIVAQVKAGLGFKTEVVEGLLVARYQFCETGTLDRLRLNKQDLQRFIAACETTIGGWPPLLLAVEAGLAKSQLEEMLQRFIVACEPTVLDWTPDILDDAPKFVIVEDRYMLAEEIRQSHLENAISDFQRIATVAIGHDSSFKSEACRLLREALKGLED